MVTGSTSGGSAGSAKNRIIDMLKADHKKVKKAFKDFEKLDSQEDAEGCEALVQQTCAELEVHAELEEQVFYPAAREAMKEDDLIEEAEVEHMTAKVLIQQLKQMSLDDEKFAATFKVLGEYINHHVKEEESEMFPALTRRDVDWDGVLEQMRTLRAQLLEDRGLPSEEEESESEKASSPRSSSSRRSGATAAEDRPQASQSPRSSAEKKK